MKKILRQVITIKTFIPLLFILLSLLFCLSSVSAADNDTIYVNTGGNDSWDGLNATYDPINGHGPKLSIKNATGTVNNGGTIYIANGIYTGVNNTGITINENMTIIGESQTGTIIDAEKQNRIFTINPGISLILQKLTLQNGSAVEGGAIYNSNGTLNVSGSTFIGNTAPYSGGAIYNYGSALNVTNCTFIGNEAQHSGAICIMTNFDISITSVNNCTFTNNRAYILDGGAIGFYNNRYVSDDPILSVNNCIFTNNYAVWNGGAIFNNAGVLTITNSTFNNNTCSGRGGAIAIDDSINMDKHPTLSVNGCTFKNNGAGIDGAAIQNGYTFGGILNVNESTFTGNMGNNVIAIFGWAQLHFNRFYDQVCEISNYYGSDIDAENNWWGTNHPDANWSNLISGFSAPTNWVILSINATPKNINNTQTSTITADLNHINGGGDLVGGHIPDGPITLNVPWGSFINPGISHSITLNALNGAITPVTFWANQGAAPSSVRVNAIADGYTTNNAEAAYITINKVANFTFDKTIISPVKGKYNVGDVITFAITVKNIGFDTMTNVSIEDELLDLLGFISASGIYSFNAAENTVTWLLPDLAANDTFTVNLTAKVLPKAAGNTVINKANIYNDLEPTHIYDKVEFYVPKSNLYIKITANKNKPKVNETFLLTYKLGNKGPDPAENVTITIPLPKGFQLTNIHGDGNWTYNKATNTITWTLKNVPVGDPYLYVSGRFTRAGVYVFGASITSDTYTINTEGTPITINTIAVANAQTVPMQKTGIPIAGLVLAVLALFSGLATSKRK